MKRLLAMFLLSSCGVDWTGSYDVSMLTFDDTCSERASIRQRWIIEDTVDVGEPLYIARSSTDERLMASHVSKTQDVCTADVLTEVDLRRTSKGFNGMLERHTVAHDMCRMCRLVLHIEGVKS
jgi:hypothetical protein